jgi:predicted DCC family thiol-disulfide oxidoreductase YuxK
MAKDTLYYDGNCELCNYEIGQLRARCDQDLQLQDIHALPQDPTLPPRKHLLQRLHLRRGTDTLLVGLDANIAAWQHTRVGGLWRLLRLPVIYPVANRIYNHWAHWRFQRLYEKSNPIMPSRHALTRVE